MKTFETKGTFQKKGEIGKFTKSVEAENEKMAKEKIYSLVGGKQKIKRQRINIEELREEK